MVLDPTDERAALRGDSWTVTDCHSIKRPLCIPSPTLVFTSTLDASGDKLACLMMGAESVCGTDVHVHACAGSRYHGFEVVKYLVMDLPGRGGRVRTQGES
jgi:hypothetical protein